MRPDSATARSRARFATIRPPALVAHPNLHSPQALYGRDDGVGVHAVAGDEERPYRRRSPRTRRCYADLVELAEENAAL